MATFHDRATSATPTQYRVFGDNKRSSSSADDESADGSWHDAVSATTSRHPGGLSSSGTQASLSAKSASLAPSNITQGSFSSDLRHSGISRNATPLPPESISHVRGNGAGDIEAATTEQRQAIIREQIEKEIKIKTGTENMLEALLAKNMKQTKEQRLRVESELSSSHRKIAQLQNELEEELMRAHMTPIEATEARRLSTFFNAGPGRSPSRATTHATGESFEAEDSESESPTVVLSETLQELEAEGMSPDYYVDRANNLVDLFKRYPTLKYDLEWSVFGLRVQVMLLSESRDVVAAGYRLTRHAIADRKSIQVIRALHTDELVMLSLVKESKASMEREQALKFVRAFLDVKDGVQELSRSVVRTLVSIAEHRDDRLRNICIMTIAELLVKDPALLFSAGGIGTLNDVLGEGTFGASESLAAGFVHVLDAPKSRKYLRAGCELNSVFANFTETVPDSDRHLKLKFSAKAISAMLKTWPGILTLAQNPERPLQSLLLSLQFPDPQSRDLILELLFDALRIKPPSWSSSFLAGRRLTTYGRVANMKSEQEKKQSRTVYEDEDNPFDLTAHFSGLILALLVEAGLINVCFSFATTRV